MSGGAFASSNLSGISDDEYLSSQQVEDRLADLRVRALRASSLEELRSVCSSFETQLVQCIHDINDLKSTEVDLRVQNRKLVKADQEHQVAAKALQDELAQYKRKHQNALDLVDYLEHQLSKNTDATTYHNVHDTGSGGELQQQQHGSWWKRSSAELDGEQTDDEDSDSRGGRPAGGAHSRTKTRADHNLRERLTQTIRDNTQLHSKINDLEAQLKKAQTTTPPQNNEPPRTYDLMALRQELENCIKQGTTPQLNVHIHHHEDHHIHNHEHQHYYGYKNLTTPRGVPATVSLENGPGSNMSVSVTAPIVPIRSSPIKN